MAGYYRLNIKFSNFILVGFRREVLGDCGESVLYGTRGVEAELWTRGGYMERRRDCLYFAMWGSSILGRYLFYFVSFKKEKIVA